MIYTVTLSPALDYVMELDKLEIGKINRSRNEKYIPGGKGINVSIVLNNLGIKSTALGFLGGFSGDYIERELEKIGIINDFVHIDGITRINVKVSSEIETAINGIGPIINDRNIKELINKISNIKNGDYLVLSGAIPKSISCNIYLNIIKSIQNKNVNVIVDTTNKALVNTLVYHPFLVKPNLLELEEIFNVKIENYNELIFYAKKLNSMGAQNVIVSMDKGALILGDTINPTFIKSIQDNVINTVGAGDSLIAGFLYKYLNSNDLIDSVKYGVSSGSATAFSSGLAVKNDIDKIYNLLLGE